MNIQGKETDRSARAGRLHPTTLTPWAASMLRAGRFANSGGVGETTMKEEKRTKEMEKAARDYCRMCSLVFLGYADDGFRVRIPSIGESVVTWKQLDMGF